MKHLTYYNEANILKDFRDYNFKVLAIPQTDIVKEIYNTIADETVWTSEWTNSSGKSDLPPDFFNGKQNIMMEVMCIDDKSEVGGTRNATKAREHELLNMLRDLGIEKDFPNVKQINILADSALSTTDDHSFVRYKHNFRRIIDKHSKKVPNYKQNHPGFTLVFFVFDESSGVYFESESNQPLLYGQSTLAQPHLYYMDTDFIDVIKTSGADYFVWFKPFNSFKTISGTKDCLPKVIIYDVKNIDIKTMSYNQNKMESSEI